ncbi:hypothetical protein C8Q78DRAFT_805503 [Trametes maxima]|nr:hypothetical protein C8Q78DRAFT_805503 [Trametes maxima]
MQPIVANFAVLAAVLTAMNTTGILRSWYRFGTTSDIGVDVKGDLLATIANIPAELPSSAASTTALRAQDGEEGDRD